MFHFKSDAKTIRNYLIIVFLIICIYLVLSVVSGSRFTSYQAIKARHWVNNTSVLLGKIEGKNYRVYVYENDDQYRTVFTEYKFPFWNASISSGANKTEDKVKLVGWLSYHDAKKGITVVPVQSFDDKVAYIEMGKDLDFQRKKVKTGDVLLFSWNKGMKWNDLNAIAYSADKKALYKLGYETTNSTIYPDELRWLPVE